MKKISLLLGIIFLLLNSSCGSDENDSQNLIIGKWKQVKSADICSTGSEDINDITGCNVNSIFTFNLNGEFELKAYYDYYVENGNERENVNCENFHESNGTWNLKDGVLTWTLNNETLVSNFIEISSEKLKIGSYDTNSGISCDGNGNISYYYIEYERIE